MKVIIAGALFAVIGLASSAAFDKCHMEKLSDCGNPLTEFRKEMGQKYPTTEEQVQTLCDKMRDSAKCAENFQNKCMTPMQLQVMGFLTEGSIEVYNEFCADESELRTQYLEHAPCLNEASSSDEAKDYNSYVEASLEDLSELPYNERLPTACCGYQWLTEKTNKMGAERCGQEAVDIFHRVVQMAVSSLPNVLCQGFNPESPRCIELMPPPGTQPKGTIKNSHVAQSFADLYLRD